MAQKLIQKIGISVSSAALVGATIFLGINSTSKYMGGIQKITFFSQSIVYRDKGFNELTFDGVRDYARYSKQMIGNQATKAYSSNGENYVSEITNLYDMGVKTIVTSGMNVANAFSADKDAQGPNHSTFDGIWKRTPKYKSKNVVIIDDNKLSQISKNAVSVGFQAEDAGFMAGVAAALYTVDLISHDSSYSPSIALWGGLPFKPVYALLSGFEQGINWFNYQVLGFGNIHDGKPNTNKQVNSWYDLTKDSKNSLNWNGSNHGSDKTPEAFKKMKEPIKINNGGSITSIDYTKPAPKGSRDSLLSDSIAEKSFYTGGFTSDKNDGQAGSNAYKKIQNSNKTKNSIVFPVAGGQTTEILSLLENHSKTMAIGVDSDASVSTPNYADNILGSATKNIRAAANYGAWYSDNNVKEKGVLKGTAKKYRDFNEKIDLTPSGEGPGWKVDDSIGTQFRGTHKNGGVGFTESESNLTNTIKDLNLLDDNSTLWNFDNLLKEVAFKSNIIIENSSNTFHIPSAHDSPITKGKTWPWIPDWENKYNG